MKSGRTVLVVSLALYVVLAIGPDIAHCFFPKGDFGYIGTHFAGRTVTFVEPHSAAADAGIQAGDRIETKYQNVHDRLFAGTGQTIIPESTTEETGSVPYPGERVTLRVLHRGHERTVTLTARPHHLSNLEIRSEIYGLAMRLIRLGLGVALVLARPGLVTWAFYLWMLGTTASGVADYWNSLPVPLWIAVMIPIHVLDAAVPFTLALFWLLFPRSEVSGWRARALPIVILGLGLSVVFALVQLLGAIYSFDTSAIDWTYDAADMVGTSIGFGALVARYLESHGLDRKLFKWLMVVVAIGYVFEMVFAFSDLFNVPVPALFYIPLPTGALLPVFIAYAILRYHLFDIEFILSRTLVYSILAVAAFLIFIAIDLAFTVYFRGSRIEVAIDIATALAIGFCVRSIHDRAIDLVDRLLFRRRYEARARLRDTFSALSGAGSQRMVEEIVTSKAAAALGLASAVFFRHFEDGGYLREATFGWKQGAIWHLLPNDPIVQMLESGVQSIDLRKIGWASTGESSPQAPAVAVPMRSGSQTVGLTLYGDRLNGVLTSPDEVKGLVDLSQRAGNMYAFFDAAALEIQRREPAIARAFR